MTTHTERVTKAEEATLELSNHRDSLDKELLISKVKAERSSVAAGARGEGIREESSKSVRGGIRSPLEGRVAETSSERGEEGATHSAASVSPDLGDTFMKKYMPRSPSFQLAPHVDMGKLAASAVALIGTITADEVEETLRRGREEYVRRDPNNVPPREDE